MLTFLTSQQLEDLHQASLRILSETGIALTDPTGRDFLLQAGARLRPGPQPRLLLPPEMVEAAIQAAGKQVAIRGRGGQVKTLGDGSLHWHNLGGARDVYDHRLGQRRAAMTQDVCDSTRLLDALDGATTITPFFTPQDVPGAIMSLAMSLSCDLRST